MRGGRGEFYQKFLRIGMAGSKGCGRRHAGVVALESEEEAAAHGSSCSTVHMIMLPRIQADRSWCPTAAHSQRGGQAVFTTRTLNQILGH
jgi:hypothetical protein